jgi:hypothetical protein
LCFSPDTLEWMLRQGSIGFAFAGGCPKNRLTFRGTKARRGLIAQVSYKYGREASSPWCPISQNEKSLFCTRFCSVVFHSHPSCHARTLSGQKVREEERTIKSLPIKMFLRWIGMLNSQLFQVQYEVNSTIHFMAQSQIDLFPAFLVVSLAFCLLDLSFPD